MRQTVRRIAYASSSLLLFLSIVTRIMLTPQPVSAFSGSGAGTQANPYVISTCEELQNIDSGNSNATRGVLYHLEGDIDCSTSSSWNGGLGFDPIDDFSGTLDGRGHQIIGLTINRPTEDGIGIFTQLSDYGLVTNLSIDDTSSFTGRYNVGSIAGYGNYAKAVGVLSAAEVSGSQLVGGLFGEVGGWEHDTIIRQSQFTGSVTATDGSAGGLVGAANNGWDMYDVLSKGDVTGVIAGGLAGTIANSCGYRNIERAAIYGTVNGSAMQAGFAGQVLNVSCNEANIRDSVSSAVLEGTGTKGGIFGVMSNASVSNSNVFFDPTTAGTADCVGTTNGDAPTCSDIGSNAPPSDPPFDEFDFTNIWNNVDPLTLRNFDNTFTGPDVPSNFTVSKGENGDGVDATIMQIDWDAPEDEGSTPLTGYRYEIKKSTDGWNDLFSDSNTDSTDSFNIYNLRLGVTYDIRVQSYNSYSGSGWITIQYSPGIAPTVTVKDCEDLAAIDDVSENRFATINLIKDIDCSGVDFAPLGYSDQWGGDDFYGTFNGHGHTIDNLTIVQEEEWSVGMFMYSEGATIKNFKMTNVFVSGYGEVGSVVGAADNTNFENIHVDGQVTASEEYAGGIAGQSDYEDGLEYTLTNLRFDGDVSGSYTLGGIIGEFDVDDPGTQVVMSEIANSGTVNGTYSTQGGIIGDLEVENDDDDNEPDTRFTLMDSYSAADISGMYEVGGLIGNSESYNDGYEVISEVIIENSYFGGSVSAEEDEAGGIIGHADDLDYEGENLTLTNNFVSGPISADNDAYALIGGEGYIDDGALILDNNYFDATATGQVDPIYDNEVIGWTAINSDPEAVDYDINYFKNNAENPPLDDWDFETIWQTVDSGFPVLRASLEVDNVVSIDINGDEIDDSTQPYLASFVNGKSGKQQAIELSDDCTIDSEAVSVQEEKQLTIQDPGFDYDSTFVNFAASCSSETITVKLYYYNLGGSYILRKYNPNTNAYSTVPGAAFATTTINGQQVLVVTYELVDNGPLDLDPTTGSIVDPVGLGTSVVNAPNTGLGGITL